MERLSSEELADLCERARTGDVEARNRFVASYLPLVVGVARSLGRLGMEMDDMVQEGAVGLMRALSGYDGTRPDASFSRYAQKKVRGAIINAALASVGTIRIPSKARGRHGIPRVGRANLGVGGLGEPADRRAGPDAEAERRDDLKWLAGAMRRLPDRDAEVVTMRYGLGGRDPASWIAIGAAMGAGDDTAADWAKRAILRLAAMAS